MKEAIQRQATTNIVTVWKCKWHFGPEWGKKIVSRFGGNKIRLLIMQAITFSSRSYAKIHWGHITDMVTEICCISKYWRKSGKEEIKAQVQMKQWIRQEYRTELIIYLFKVFFNPALRLKKDPENRKMKEFKERGMVVLKPSIPRKAQKWTSQVHPAPTLG